MRVAHHKLVRDQIRRSSPQPEASPSPGSSTMPVTRLALRAKLLEEAHEAKAAADGQLASELADVLEVLRALAAAYHMSWEDIVSEAARKRTERGGFHEC